MKDAGPVRVQLRRTKGWRMPPNTVMVTRPGLFGNPFSVAPTMRPGARVGSEYIAVPTAEDAVACYREMFDHPGERADAMRAALPTLRGKNLACWCKPGEPCHADVLLEIANSPDQAA